jgi:hypothetical protein
MPDNLHQLFKILENAMDTAQETGDGVVELTIDEAEQLIQGLRTISDQLRTMGG